MDHRTGWSHKIRESGECVKLTRMAHLHSKPEGVRLRAVAAALLGLATLPGLAGCGSDNSSNATSAGPMRTRKTIGAPGAKVGFATPREASTAGSTLVARVTLTHFKLAPNKVGKAAKQGEGHLH